MSLDQLKKHIKDNNFSNFYLFYGEEQYLIRHYKNALIQAILGEKGGMNFSSFEGKNPDTGEILSTATTLPFFTSHRVILIENSDLFSTKNEFAEELSLIPPSTILIFSEQNVDRKTRMFKAVSKLGLALDFPREKSENLSKWILSFFSKNQIKISDMDANHLLMRVGQNMDLLYLEMEKLISYAAESKVVTREDIDLICPETLQDKIFKLMDSLAEKDRQAALSFYYDLVDLREPMLRILSLIIRHFHILRAAKKLQSEGRSMEFQSLLKLHPYVAKNYLAMANRFSLSFLEEALEYAASLDKEIKTGAIHEKIAVEHLILTYTSK